MILSLCLATTVAQPFGIVAQPRQSAPSGAREIDNTSVHVIRVAGIPIVPFVLYDEPFLVHGENNPSAALKARSWFWLPILINGTTVMKICAPDVDTPCWKTSGSERSNLRSQEKDGHDYVVVDNSLAADAPPTPTLYTWELTYGIASIAGVIYWTLLVVLIPMLPWSLGPSQTTRKRIRSLRRRDHGDSTR